MEINLRTRDLMTELAVAQGIVDRKTTIPILGNVLLNASGDKLELTASDLEMTLRTSCAAEVIAEGSTSVPMQWLYDYGRLLTPDSELSISTSANDSLQLKCGAARARIQGANPKAFPEARKLPEEWLQLSVRILVAAIRRTLISVSTDQGPYEYGAGLLVLRKNSIGMVSTDGHRLSFYSEEFAVGDLPEDVDCLIPRKAMASLLKMLEAIEDGQQGSATVEFALDENHVFFRSGCRAFMSRKMSGAFPDYERVMPKDLALTREFNCDDLRLTLRRVAQFSPSDSHAVQFLLKDGELQLTARTAQFGESQESMPVAYEDNPLEVGFSAKYILEFLDVCMSDKVTVSLKDPKSAAEFGVPDLGEGKQYRYVIMPVRV